jgi:predicted GH43/DUF377 family glycosyl hydrolase
MTAASFVVRSPTRLLPDAARVIGQLFVPGHALAGQSDDRASTVVSHVLGLTDAEVAAELDDIVARFDGRHRDLLEMFELHAGRLANRLAPDIELSGHHRALLGATFTQEVAVEAAAVCNPSAVAAVDQAGIEPDALRIVLSVRQIGEGHRSTIGFRSVVVDSHGEVSIEARGPYTAAGAITDVELDSEVFSDLSCDADGDSVRWVLDGLGPRFASSELLQRVRQLQAQQDTRRDVAGTAARITERAARCYAATFPTTSTLAERILTPGCAVESNGLEDARFVRFVDEGTVTYHATYTAYNGSTIAQQLLTTTDFATFTSTPLLGHAAADKGMALFPRKIGGHYHALCRSDGARNALAVSDNIWRWPASSPLHVADTAWSSVHSGNCGPPIELDEGWLVLTHGVGAIRTYSIGALLLDLDDPRIVIGQTAHPLITPRPDERDGYVPNVVYSCGAVRHGELIVVPLGLADCRIGFATFTVADVLSAMTGAANTSQSAHQEVTSDA